MYRLDRSDLGFWYDALKPPVLTVASGESVTFETLDARSGALANIPVGTLFDLPKPPVGRGNPLTGPLAIEGAQTGDALAVTIEEIRVIPPGWVGGHAHANPLAPGRIPRPLGRSCDVVDGDVIFSDSVRFPSRPMVGCIGTATGGEPENAGTPGRFGGNMDQQIVGPGATVYLPINVDGALLYIGDVHANQGDGELSGVAVEIAAEVRARVELHKNMLLSWPWIETADVLAVATAAWEFVDARREAVDAMITVMESQMGLQPAEALALLSAVADLRLGQAYGGNLQLTLRLEVPRALGLRPA